jgi:hypothetical protein
MQGAYCPFVSPALSSVFCFVDLDYVGCVYGFAYVCLAYLHACSFTAVLLSTAAARCGSLRIM